uniref:Uncharacterized protein n=1 Tax=Chlamydomonas euryale TaxID=1486919 RepID=A0A7R9VTD1_9CHLO
MLRGAVRLTVTTDLELGMPGRKATTAAATGDAETRADAANDAPPPPPQRSRQRSAPDASRRSVMLGAPERSHRDQIRLICSEDFEAHIIKFLTAQAEAAARASPSNACPKPRRGASVADSGGQLPATDAAQAPHGLCHEQPGSAGDPLHTHWNGPRAGGITVYGRACPECGIAGDDKNISGEGGADGDGGGGGASCSPGVFQIFSPCSQKDSERSSVRSSLVAQCAAALTADVPQMDAARAADDDGGAGEAIVHVAAAKAAAESRAAIARAAAAAAAATAAAAIDGHVHAHVHV